MAAAGRIQNTILFQSRRPHTQGCLAGRNAVPFLAVFIIDHNLPKETGQVSQGVRTTDCKKENLSVAEAGKANKLHNHLSNNSHGGGWSADLTTGKRHCTSTLPIACELETPSQKPTTGTATLPAAPSRALSCWGTSRPSTPESTPLRTYQCWGCTRLHH